jgi:hypothetical protein
MRHAMIGNRAKQAERHSAGRPDCSMSYWPRP